jgi:cytidylate kinase
MIVVIDGPAGSGKSSTAKAVADRLGIEYLDSGALYRALAVMYLEAGKDPDTFFELLDKKVVTFEYSDRVFHVAVDGTDFTHRLRSKDVAGVVSLVASMPECRSYVNRMMRAAAEQGEYIAEGRDLGTVVFPNAELKFYMSADLEARTQRRFDELQEQRQEITLEEVRRNILKRDRIDSQRKIDPLRKAEDAIVIDTTHLNFEQQVKTICSKVSEVINTKSLNNNP